MFNDRMINEVVRRVLLEAKADAIINEEDNPAYVHTKAKAKQKNSIGQLWRAIERKQEELQGMVFGELGNALTDITAEKAKSMGSEHVRVPNTICNAGNSKLPPSVLIINMSSSLMCPSFYLGICTITDGRCYAQQSENQHSNSVLPNRWQTDLMHTQMLQQYKSGNKNPMKKYFGLVEMYIQLGNAYATKLARAAIKKLEREEKRVLSKEERAEIDSSFDRYRISDIRLNETGDFHCQLAVDLWSKFADKIKRKYGINTHAYTARNLDFSDASKHMSINASHSGINMGDEPERRFRAVPEDFYNSLTEGTEVKDRQPILGYNGHVFFYKCPCGNDESMCDRCGVCFDRNRTGRPYTIFVKYHGMKKANGLKHLFTKREVEGVMDKLYKNGWVTDDEYRSWASDKNQRFLDNLSGKIGGMRSR